MIHSPGQMILLLLVFVMYAEIINAIYDTRIIILNETDFVFSLYV